MGETYYASVKNERTKKLRLAMSPVPRPYPLKVSQDAAKLSHSLTAAARSELEYHRSIATQ